MLFLQLSILAHILSDFIFQNDEIISLKNSSDKVNFKKGHRLHCFIVIILNLIFLLPLFNPIDVIIFSLLVTLSHYFIDTIKYKFFNGNDFKKLISFIIDQLLHFLVILTFWSILDTNITSFITYIISHIPQKIKLLFYFFTRNSLHNLVNCLIIYIYFCLAGGVFIELCIKWLRLNNNSNSLKNSSPVQAKLTKGNSLCQLLNKIQVKTLTNFCFKKEFENSEEEDISVSKPSIFGKYIGIFERLIIITLVIKDSYSAIAFVFTAKSLARANEIGKNKKNFAEYYLVGTLLSTAIAMIAGILLKFLLNN